MISAAAAAAATVASLAEAKFTHTPSTRLSRRDMYHAGGVVNFPARRARRARTLSGTLRQD